MPDHIRILSPLSSFMPCQGFASRSAWRKESFLQLAACSLSACHGPLEEQQPLTMPAGGSIVYRTTCLEGCRFATVIVGSYKTVSFSSQSRCPVFPLLPPATYNGSVLYTYYPPLPGHRMSSATALFLRTARSYGKTTPSVGTPNPDYSQQLLDEKVPS